MEAVFRALRQHIPGGPDSHDAHGSERELELYTWGSGSDYQLGYGARAEQLVPRLVPLPGKVVVVSVACGRYHSVAVTACGSVLCWGFDGSTGRLGEFASAGGGGSFIVEPARLSDFGPGRQCAVKAVAGLCHTVVLAASGKVLAWGSNEQGQLGVAGVGLGSGAGCSRPLELKAKCMRGEAIRDIAAGAAHTLCVVGEGGNVFAWGSNERGALGLGVPPRGPFVAATPQQLPHIRGAALVFASTMHHISVAILALGDAMIFGGAPQSSCSFSALANPSPKMGPRPPPLAPSSRELPDLREADARFGVPTRITRVRRPVVCSSMDDIDEDNWQVMRTTAAANVGQGRLVGASLGASDGFAVDDHGLLWTWPLLGPRPCNAEAISTESARPPPRQPAVGRMGGGSNREPTGFRCVCVAEKNGTVWAVDSSPAARLWKLQRCPAKGGWRAEFNDAIAQVAAIACGPEHQAAIIGYRRLVVSAPEHRTASPEDVDTGDSPMGLEDGCCNVLGYAMGDVPPSGQDPSDNTFFGGASSSTTVSHQGRTGPPSLQRLCERRLQRLLTPRNLSLVCEVAWELNLPDLLDFAYSFVLLNEPLLSARSVSPLLSCLPSEVLIAFERCALGQLQAASQALDLLPGELLASSAKTVGEAAGSRGLTSRRRRRGGACASNIIEGDGTGGAASTGVGKLQDLRAAVFDPSMLHRPATPLVGTVEDEGQPSPAVDNLSTPVIVLAPVTPSEPPRGVWGPATRASEVDSHIDASFPPLDSVTSAVATRLVARCPEAGVAAMNPGRSSSISAKFESPGEWTSVGSNRNSSCVGTRGGSGKSTLSGAQPAGGSARAAQPRAGVLGSPSGAPGESPVLGLRTADQPRPTPLCLGDFVAPRLESGSTSAAFCPEPEDGPSALLSAALRAARSAGWGARSASDAVAGDSAGVEGSMRDQAAASMKMRDIIAESEAAAAEKGERGLAAGSRRRKSEGGVSATNCKWGFDAMPSEQPKGRSVYDVQREELEAQARAREAEELLAIEAMFDALEVAERAEKEELVNGALSTSAATSSGSGAAGKRRGGNGRADYAKWNSCTLRSLDGIGHRLLSWLDCLGSFRGEDYGFSLQGGRVIFGHERSCVESGGGCADGELAGSRQESDGWWTSSPTSVRQACWKWTSWNEWSERDWRRLNRGKRGLPSRAAGRGTGSRWVSKPAEATCDLEAGDDALAVLGAAAA